MASVLVCGLINVETTLRVDGFPIPYAPVRYPFHGVSSTISGVGYNIAKALIRLGHDVRLCALVGQDMESELVRQACKNAGIETEYILSAIKHTAHSVIIFDKDGRRQINVDLKDLQETEYPRDVFERALQGCQLAILCNINYSRPGLGYVKQQGIPIATDVHTLSDIHDSYNSDFMRSADILFMSHEAISNDVHEWARRTLTEYHNQVLVISMGSGGALLTLASGDQEHLAASITRPVVNSIGAGDALFSAYVHGSLMGLVPREALRQAQIYASWKIGENGAAEGLLNAQEFEALVRDMDQKTAY